MFIQCSPHNPAGRVWSEEELDRVLAICMKHEVLVTSDEIHQDIMTGGCKFVPSAVVADSSYRDIVLTLSSATKTFNLATLLHSHIIITNDALMKRYDAFASGLNRTEVSIMGMTATMEGYKHGGEWLSGLLALIRSNYDFMKSELSRELPDAVTCCLEGTYLAMIDLRKCLDPSKTCEIIQGKCRLAVDYGEWFGEGCEGFIRVNLATDPAIIRRAVGNLVRELKH